ncbi:MAG: ABC transporter substrate-binding protein [Planctomycetes bacterium]|nr:ABC transporter substrate-binding protein [Planctomycetota bacterium]
MTETVCRLGAADRLVGVTRYCTHPAEQLGDIVRVGGTKNPVLERIALLAPDLVIGNSEENRAEDLAWLRARFPLLVHEPRTVTEASSAVHELGGVLQCADAAQAMVLAIAAQVTRSEVAMLERGTTRVFYAIWKKPWMGANRTTFIHDVLQRAGAVNVCADAGDRYPTVEPAVVARAGVDLVLLPSEPWEFSDEDRRQVLAAEQFGANVPVLLCDGRDFCWHGAHTATGLARALDLLLPFRPARRPA